MKDKMSATYFKNAKPRKGRENAKTKEEKALCKTFHGDGGGLGEASSNLLEGDSVLL